MMHIRRLTIRNFRNFEFLDVQFTSGINCVVGENNAGKSNLLHAIRLVLDAKLSGYNRNLTASDFCTAVDYTKPTQILVAVELVGFDDTQQKGFASLWSQDGHVAKLVYRFRPSQLIVEDAPTGVYEGGPLRLDDYEYEIVSATANDPETVKWFEPLGKPVSIAKLNHFSVEFLPALRDVEQDLGQARTSPLEKLLAISRIPLSEQQAIEAAFRDANDKLRAVATIDDISKTVQQRFADIAADVLNLKPGVGVVDPAFTKLARSLTMLFETGSGETLDLERSGLGINNLLYIGMVAEYFRRRIELERRPGQLFLIDEPEAHLHPHAQRVLYSALRSKPFQTIVTTHSNNITSHAEIAEQIVLVVRNSYTVGVNLTGALDTAGAADIARYLDATRSTLLFARSVILVEGPAELFILPVLAKEVLNIDLDREFVSVVPIYGKHFAPYAALFGEKALRKRCAIVADGDSPLPEAIDGTDPGFAPIDLSHLNNEYVQVFQNNTTFEKTLAVRGLLPSISRALAELGHPVLAKRFAEAQAAGDAELDGRGEAGDLGKSLLYVANYHGKGRFAQVLSKHLKGAFSTPDYLREALYWVTARDT